MIVEIASGIGRGFVVFYHSIDDAPIGQSAKVAVVNPHIGSEFAWSSVVPYFLWIVFVDGIEFESALAAVFYGLVEEFAFANGPKYELMVAFVLKAFEHIDGEWYWFADGRVGVFYDSAIEVYGDDHMFRYSVASSEIAIQYYSFRLSVASSE